jgi:AcrR family transcriptional regulator
MRADAHRNRERVLDAAIEVFLERGVDAPLDAIARRADVGIGTLYRRFPNRDALANSVGLHVLDLSSQAATEALDRAPDAYAALRDYVHAAIDLGVGVLNLLYPKVTDPHWDERRATAARTLEKIVEQAKREGRLRTDVRIPDIGFAIVRFSRPVAPGLTLEEERAIAHRHLDIYLDGLQTDGHKTTPLAAPHAMDQFDPASG